MGVHARSLKEHGGSEGVLEPGLVESCWLPQRTHIISGTATCSQAFVDGNKRTGIAAALIFLARNGVYNQQPKWAACIPP